MKPVASLDLIRLRTHAEAYLLDIIDKARAEGRKVSPLNNDGPMIGLAPRPLRAACAQALRDLADKIERTR